MSCRSIDDILLYRVIIGNLLSMLIAIQSHVPATFLAESFKQASSHDAPPTTNPG